MGMTIIEKILAHKAGRERVEVGEFVVCDVDMTVLIDLQFATLWVLPTRIADADRLAVIMDHAVPAPSVSDADGGVRAREFAAQHGVERFFDIGRHGICHQVIAENGLARPGEILACTDSHTCAAGAYNAAARGLGPAEVYSIMCTGRTWFQIAPTYRYDLTGEKPAHISGKDVFLHIAGEYGDATNHNLEFGGPGLRSVPMKDDRDAGSRGLRRLHHVSRRRRLPGVPGRARGRAIRARRSRPRRLLRGGPRGRPVRARALRGEARLGGPQRRPDL